MARNNDDIDEQIDQKAAAKDKKTPVVTPQIKSDFNATFNPRQASFANAQGGGDSTAPAPTIATATAPPPVTPQVKQDFASYFGDVANGPARTLSSATDATASPDKPARALTAAPASDDSNSTVPLPPGGLRGLASTIAGMAPMATAPAPAPAAQADKIPSLVPPNGGRAPGGPFDPSSFPKAPPVPTAAAVPAPQPAMSARPPEGAVRRTTYYPVMGALAADMTAARGMTKYRPVSEGVVSGAAGSAIDAYAKSSEEAARRALNLPESPAAATQAAPTKPATQADIISQNGFGAPAVEPPSPATATPAAAAAARPGNAVSDSAGAAGSDTTAAQATSINGRPLGFGRMENGVRVFSDGSGGPNAVPRTMSDADIANLGKESRVTRADSGVGGNIDSVAYRSGASLGGGAASRVLAGTPELGSDAGLALSRPLTPRAADGGGRFHMPSAADQRIQDFAAALGRDTRTSAGLAMRNADVEARSKLGRAKAGAEMVARNKDIASMYGDALRQDLANTGSANVENVRGLTELQRTGLENGNRLATTAMNNQSELARTLLTRGAGQEINMADGTLGLLGPDGVVRAALDQNGNAVRPQIGKTADEIASMNKAVEDRTKTLLGVDPVTGLIAGADGKGRAATAKELSDATDAARASLGIGGSPAREAAAPTGVATATNPRTGKKMVLQNGKWVDA